jgi:hypothetical protein
MEMDLVIQKLMSLDLKSIISGILRPFITLFGYKIKKNYGFHE